MACRSVAQEEVAIGFLRDREWPGWSPAEAMLANFMAHNGVAVGLWAAAQPVLTMLVTAWEFVLAC